MALIHKTAIVEDGAILADDVTVGPYTIIGSQVKIGAGTTIESHCVIKGKTTIGKNNTIFSHAALGTEPQDLKFAGEDVELIIGDNNKIREFTLFNPGTKGGGSVTKIGNGSLFMGYTHVAHDCIIGDNCIFANGATLAGHVEVENNVVVGGLSAIHQFCKLGESAMIGGGSILVQDIPPFCICEGNRASLRSLNLNGLRRRFEDRKDIDAIRKAYKSIFESGQPMQDVAKELIQNSDNKYVQQLAKFVVNTKRGIPFIRK